MKWRWGVVYHEDHPDGTWDTTISNFRTAFFAVRAYRKCAREAMKHEASPDVSAAWAILAPVDQTSSETGYSSYGPLSRST